VLLKACLNGTRRRSDHARCPITPGELAREGKAVVAAGAGAIHVHPRDEDGDETLDGPFVAAALEVMRAHLSVPIGISTGAWFLPDPAARLRAIARWEVLPDFASVNFHEVGAEQIARALLDRGVGVEAGIWSGDAATVLAECGLGEQCLRILIEPMEQELDRALGTLRDIENRLDGVSQTVPRLLHGFEMTAWPLLEHASPHGYDTRMGLEDTLTRQDGTIARDNAELIQLAVGRIHTEAAE
jgi:uncharacterized protein (DUF849 family)